MLICSHTTFVRFVRRLIEYFCLFPYSSCPPQIYLVEIISQSSDFSPTDYQSSECDSRRFERVLAALEFVPSQASTRWVCRSNKFQMHRTRSAELRSCSRRRRSSWWQKACSRSPTARRLAEPIRRIQKRHKNCQSTPSECILRRLAPLTGTDWNLKYANCDEIKCSTYEQSTSHLVDHSSTLELGYLDISRKLCSNIPHTLFCIRTNSWKMKSTPCYHWVNNVGHPRYIFDSNSITKMIGSPISEW